MKLRVLSLAVVVGLVSQVSYAYTAYIENDCSQYGGNQTCIEPLPPEPTSPWVYDLDDELFLTERFSNLNDLFTAFKQKRSVKNPVLTGNWLPAVMQYDINTQGREYSLN